MPRSMTEHNPSEPGQPGCGPSASMRQEAYVACMRGLFESTVSQALAKMGESLAARNAPEIVLHAHSITNSAVVVGATALAGLARAIETKAMTGNIEGIEKQYRLMLTFNLAEIQISVPVIPGL